MNLTLSRAQYREEGIFGELLDEQNHFLFVTLEHAYPGLYGYAPKVPVGTYTCRRSLHRLVSMAHDFETFELLDVPGHSDILFHCGNTNADSAGCILLGESMLSNSLYQSRNAFKKFMELQAGEAEFLLIVQ